MEPVFFIGYKFLEELLTVIDKTRPVFANITIEQERFDLSQRSERIVIMVAQPEQDLGESQNLAGRAWLDIRPGLIAHPAELQFLDGWARFL